MPGERRPDGSAPLIKAVIFDMDGVLIDSEHLWEKSESVLLERNGIGTNEEYRRKYRKKIMGLNQKDSVKLLKDAFGLRQSFEEILEERIRILLELYETELVTLADGAGELLDALGRKKEIKTAVASASPMRVIEVVLVKFSLENAFEAVTSGECVERGKPHPEIYLETARRLGTSPAQCVAIEDSVNGILSAASAGMRCIAVPDPKVPEREYPPADMVRKTVSEIRLEDIESLDNEPSFSRNRTTS